ncbi:MAG: 50S ribosomal protein L35 [Bacilli bacterium]|nr:50S ribosomal protein L35 [Bacilli bacterium]
MPKMKSSRTLAKRIKVTGTGKIKIKHAYMGHFAPNKTHKQKKHLAKRGLLHKTDVARVRDMIYKGL